MNLERELLMIPGPTIVSPRVLRALSRPMISHTSKEFTEGFAEALEMQRWLFMTRGTPFLLAGSGTLGMEAAAANVVERGDRILCVENGLFGERWKEIVAAHGGLVDRLTFDWGEAVDPKMVGERLAAGGYKAFTVEHVETSTGIANDLEAIGRAAEGSGALHIVDSVCGLGGMPLRMDEWNIDICLTGSQKALGAPPGLALLCVSDGAWRAVESRRTPVADFYTDLTRWRPVMEGKRYFATPAVGLVLGMLEALRIVREEGLEARWRRHRVFSEAFRSGLEALGVASFPARGSEAHTLSVPVTPEGVKTTDLVGLMRQKYGVVVAAGLGRLAERTVRVGHMGSVTTSDIVATMGALEMALIELGYRLEPGAGVGAAERVLVTHTVEK